MTAPERSRRFGCLVAVALVVAACSGTTAAPSDGSSRDGATTRSAAADEVLHTTSSTGGHVDPGVTTEPPASSTTVPELPPRPITLAFSGDVLLHMPVNQQAARNGSQSGAPFDYRPMFEPMRPIIEGADLAVCHLEVPVAPDGRLTSYPSFGAPPQIAVGLAQVGYDGCSTASNHSLDRGYSGVIRTLEELDAAGLAHAGTARGQWETGPAWYRVGENGREIDVAHLSYAYGFNGYRTPTDAPWAANQIDTDRIRVDAADARSSGAELVVVSLHWGTEYRHDPDAYQRMVADQILPSSDIDLVIGHHAHVVQPIEVVEGTYVVWGLGNQISNQSQAPRRDGLTVVATASPGWDGRWRVSGIEAVPTWVEAGSFRVLPVASTLGDPAVGAGLRDELEGSYSRTSGIIGSRSTPGVRVSSIAQP